MGDRRERRGVAHLSPSVGVDLKRSVTDRGRYSSSVKSIGNRCLSYATEPRTTLTTSHTCRLSVTVACMHANLERSASIVPLPLNVQLTTLPFTTSQSNPRERETTHLPSDHRSDTVTGHLNIWQCKRRPSATADIHAKMLSTKTHRSVSEYRTESGSSIDA
jgi:hypothetical protein